MTNPFTTFAPTVTPPRLPETDVSFTLHDTSVGRLLLACAAGRLILCAYAVDDLAQQAHLGRVAAAVSPRILRHPAPLDTARQQLDDYLLGRRQAFDLATGLTLTTTFQRSVLSGLSGTAYGQTTSYGALAASIGAPTAARAVGSALGANPLCIVLPCHRVLPAASVAARSAVCVNAPGIPGVFTHTGGAAIGGYAGGPAAKAALLTLEAGRSAVPE